MHLRISKTKVDIKVALQTNCQGILKVSVHQCVKVPLVHKARVETSNGCKVFHTIGILKINK